MIPVKKEVRKKVETSEKYRDTQREKGDLKIVGNSPWGPQKGPIKIFEKMFFKKEYRRCVLKILTW
jgi:hypothetical protein